MILADSSVWIDHLRYGDTAMIRELEATRILIHPFVIGEIAFGSLKQRPLILSLLHDLPSVTVADDAEVLGMIELEGLFSLGLGYVDAHLLASMRLTPGARLWTRDRRLRDAAERLELSIDPAAG
jgi:predicted nucleic acid-binding protein